ncbi:DUF1918 domain-containing protein [Streptomyces sp. NBC_00454]|uniref:DUF1918 domain-containing protein n=1 Tax=Streptomyces sp. NBC_00454 TaxID=2975747 RepID=UPI00352C7E6B
MNAHPLAHGDGIHAEVGDQIIVGGPTVGTTGRDGEVIALHHEDGTPPYDVRWSDTGRTTVIFPDRTPTSASCTTKPVRRDTRRSRKGQWHPVEWKGRAPRPEIPWK